MIKCWVYGNEQTRQGPCPLDGQLRNKLWIIRYVRKERTTAAASQACPRYSGRPGLTGKQHSQKTITKNNEQACQPMKILQEVYLSKTFGAVAQLLLNTLSLARIEEICWSKLN